MIRTNTPELAVQTTLKQNFPFISTLLKGASCSTRTKRHGCVIFGKQSRSFRPFACFCRVNRDTAPCKTIPRDPRARWKRLCFEESTSSLQQCDLDGALLSLSNTHTHTHTRARNKFIGPSQRRLASEPWASPNLAGLNGSQPRSLGQRSISESTSRYLELGSKQVGAEASLDLLPEPINWRVQEAALSVDDASLRDNTPGSDRKVFICSVCRRAEIVRRNTRLSPQDQEEELPVSERHLSGSSWGRATQELESYLAEITNHPVSVPYPEEEDCPYDYSDELPTAFDFLQEPLNFPGELLRDNRLGADAASCYLNSVSDGGRRVTWCNDCQEPPITPLRRGDSSIYSHPKRDEQELQLNDRYFESFGGNCASESSKQYHAGRIRLDLNPESTPGGSILRIRSI